MKAKKSLAFVCTLTLCLLLVLAGFAFWSATDSVTKANYDRVAKGMTLTEVAALFGKAGVPFHGYPHNPANAYCWVSDDRSLAVLFFDDKLTMVEKATWADSTETGGDKLSRLLRRAWGK